MPTLPSDHDHDHDHDSAAGAESARAPAPAPATAAGQWPVTQQPADATSAAPEPHRARDMAESFGTDPARYDRTRPRYPDELIARIAGGGGRARGTGGAGPAGGGGAAAGGMAVEGAGAGARAGAAGGAGAAVLDVGTGTGIVARQLRAAGCRVLGLDVDARMAAYARRDGHDVEVAAFEDWDPAGRRFDAVVAGQTWHWIDPVAGAAKAAEVLRPGGRLAAFWNVSQPAPDVAEALGAAFRDALPGAPLNPWSRTALDGYSAITEKTADGIRRTGAFGEPEEWRYGWEHTYTRDEWLDQLPTGGGMARIPPAQQTALLDATAAAVDALGGTFTMSYTALAVTAAVPASAS